MKLADYVIQTLADYGIDLVGLIYGSAIGDLVDAFTRPGAPKYWCGQHEQGVGFAMEGYAKVSGKIGCAMATSGPGGMNLVTPIGNAFYDSVPMLFLTGNVKTQYMRQDESIRQVGFQESPIVDIVKPITKYAAMIHDPADVRYHLEKAIFLCRHRRAGPVLLDFPIDVQKADIDPEQLEGFDAMEYLRHDAQAPIERVDNFVLGFIEDLERAQRPVVLIGGGCQGYGALFRETFAPLGIPCYPTYNSVDVVTSDFPWYGGRIGTYGGAGRNFGIQNCDLLLAIGSRISGRITGGNPATFARGAKKYLVDVDRALLDPANQAVPFDRALDCDAALFMRRLGAAVSKPIFNGDDWTRQCMQWRASYDTVVPHLAAPVTPLDPYLFMHELSRQAPANAIICSDCGGNWIITAHAFQTKTGQRLFTSNGNSPMGFSFAGAIGAWFADPARPVVCLIGDGGMGMNSQELQTVVKYGVNIKVFIIQNRTYGITRAYQEKNFEGRQMACGPDGYSSPDFQRVAAAYGVRSYGIYSTADIERGIRTVMAASEAVICEVVCPDFHTYEPFVKGWDTGIEDMHPLLPRDEFRSNMIVDPLPGWEGRK